MKILLADDHPLIRSGLRAELATLDGHVEFLEASDAQTLRAMFDRHRDLDLAIVDLSMPGMQREVTIAELRRDFATTPLIVLSGADPAADAKAVLRAGASGFIPKNGMSKVMLQAIRLVLAGGQYLPPQMIGDGEPHAVPPGTSSPRAPVAPSGGDGGELVRALGLLSERQRQVFALLAEGLSNKAIARRLDITEGTVKTHVATIFDVFNVHNRVAAVAAARALSLKATREVRDESA
ncbi:MAG TPA: response regulator transcription factor [Casimicrobiaceae bacterium]|jgi:DNA-binding NarL/FixJ family response regulator|nr:response regulator transcription factor [Casimicrobiaceae bacterium]